MKKNLFFWIMALMICAAVGCADKSSSLETDDNTRNEEELWETGVWESRHFITDYLVPSAIAVVVDEKGVLNLKVSGAEYPTTEEVIPEEAKYFIKLYGDTAYEGYVHPGMSPALSYPIDKITIYCDKDFDAKHAAGEPLDDIAQLDFNSFYPFVKNGYQLFPKSEESPNGDTVHYELIFDSVDAELTKLIQAKFLTNKISPSYVAKIEFCSTPEVPGEYTFNLAVTINGETLTTTFTHTFE